MNQLSILIAEIEAYEKSLKFMAVGRSQVTYDGEEQFCCNVCGHCPKLLIERLKIIQEQLKETE